MRDGPQEHPFGYHAYMLRMWQERAASDEHSAIWRLQLEDPHTGRRYGFRDLDALLLGLGQVAAGDELAGGATAGGPTAARAADHLNGRDDPA